MKDNPNKESDMKRLYLESDLDGLQQFNISDKDAATLQRTNADSAGFDIFKNITGKDINHFLCIEAGEYTIKDN